MIPKHKPCHCCQHEAGHLIRFTKKDAPDAQHYVDFLCDDCLRCIYDVEIEPKNNTEPLFKKQS